MCTNVFVVYILEVGWEGGGIVVGEVGVTTDEILQNTFSADTGMNRRGLRRDETTHQAVELMEDFQICRYAAELWTD